MSYKYVLDASALLALLNNGPGATTVSQHFAESVISTVNLAEVVTVLNKAGIPDGEIRVLLDELDLPCLAYSKDVAIATGGIRALTASKGLSLGDRACLMTAKYLECITLTTDRAWLSFTGSLGVKVELIR